MKALSILGQAIAVMVAIVVSVVVAVIYIPFVVVTYVVGYVGAFVLFILAVACMSVVRLVQFLTPKVR